MRTLFVDCGSQECLHNRFSKRGFFYNPFFAGIFTVSASRLTCTTVYPVILLRGYWSSMAAEVGCLRFSSFMLTGAIAGNILSSHLHGFKYALLQHVECAELPSEL